MFLNSFNENSYKISSIFRVHKEKQSCLKGKYFIISKYVIIKIVKWINLSLLLIHFGVSFLSFIAVLFIIVDL